MMADGGGLPDDDAGAVVDEEPGADLRAGVDVDARDLVGIFRHHPGQDGHPHLIELVGDAENADGLESGVGEHDLVCALGRRVAPVGGFHVLVQGGLDGGQLPDQLQGRFLIGPGVGLHLAQGLLQKDKGILQAQHADVAVPPPVLIAAENVGVHRRAQVEQQLHRHLPQPRVRGTAAVVLLAGERHGGLQEGLVPVLIILFHVFSLGNSGPIPPAGSISY